eukprot:XP_014063111.1 PREDICTED: WAS/WASL-interacting protein family member 3-like [Salmo salar]
MKRQQLLDLTITGRIEDIGEDVVPQRSRPCSTCLTSSRATLYTATDFSDSSSWQTGTERGTGTESGTGTQEGGMVPVGSSLEGNLGRRRTLPPSIPTLHTTQSEREGRGATNGIPWATETTADYVTHTTTAAAVGGGAAATIGTSATGRETATAPTALTLDSTPTPTIPPTACPRLCPPPTPPSPPFPLKTCPLTLPMIPPSPLA